MEPFQSKYKHDSALSGEFRPLFYDYLHLLLYAGTMIFIGEIFINHGNTEKRAALQACVSLYGSKVVEGVATTVLNTGHGEETFLVEFEDDTKSEYVDPDLTPEEVSEEILAALPLPAPERTMASEDKNEEVQVLRKVAGAVAVKSVNAKEVEPMVEVAARPIATEPNVKTWYALQVASHPNADLAQKDVDERRMSGHTVYYVPVTVDGKSWYRVMVGRFAVREEVYEFQKLYQSQVREKSIVRKIASQ